MGSIGEWFETEYWSKIRALWSLSSCPGFGWHRVNFPFSSCFGFNRRRILIILMFLVVKTHKFYLSSNSPPHPAEGEGEG